MNKLKKQQGFTLVELLIVIVILGVLAAMVVPRMLAQANAADTAEAIQMLGTIRRQAVARLDAGGVVPAFSTNVAMGAGSPWQNLGMGDLTGQPRKFDYADAGGTGATATLIGSGGASALTINYQSGLFTCTGYTAVLDNSTPANTIGCR